MLEFVQNNNGGYKIDIAKVLLTNLKDTIKMENLLGHEAVGSSEANKSVNLIAYGALLGGVSYRKTFGYM